jgi:formiminoglutamase
MNLQHFRYCTRENLKRGTRLRRYETKAGERFQVSHGTDLLARLTSAKATYVIFGIPENIGVKANGGTGGTATAWPSFLEAFLNIQSNDFFSGDAVMVLGHFDFTDLERLIDSNAGNEEERVVACRHAVAAIDEEVEKLVKAIVSAGKFPIVIGGGHNNAYPLLKGAAKGLQQAQQTPIPQINCINLDAHADYRPEEGRHSGNAFRYAESDGFLQKYCVIGLHENYLQQNVWVDLVNNPFMDCITYEDIFIHEKRSFIQAVAHAIDFTEDGFTGIELDLDSIENVLSSAMTPCGISAREARQYVSLCAASTKAAYLHLCEGATVLEDGKKNEATGKLLSYLVTDFIKMHMD